MKLTSLLLLSLLGTSLVACGEDSSDDDATGGGTTGGAGGGGTGGDACVPDPPTGDFPLEHDDRSLSEFRSDEEFDAVELSADDLTGTWVYVEIQTLRVNAPTIGQVGQRVVSLYLVEQTVDGTEVTLDGPLCDRWVENEGQNVVNTKLPVPFRAIMPPIVQWKGTYDPSAEPPLQMEPIIEVVGYETEDPSTPADQPTEPDAPNVLDPDRDCKPGSTTRLAGIASGNVYTTTWARRVPAGTPRASDEIVGGMPFESHQPPLGSDPESIVTLYREAEADPRSELSGFILKKVDAATTCADVNADITEILPIVGL